MATFDARTAKALAAGEHLTIDGCPGLRLKATASTRTWVYRFKSPIDGKMRQTKLGHWPAVSRAEAEVAWQGLKKERRAGRDVVVDKRQVRVPKVAPYTVKKLCDHYLSGHVDVARKSAGAKQIRGMFAKHTKSIINCNVSAITRADAFSLLESMQHIPVTARSMRAELGAAWDWALDSGRVPQTTFNWWRLVYKGKLKSKGRKREGVNIGTKKRYLKDDEVGTLLRWLPLRTERMRDVLTLYLWTGCRGVEIVAMEHDEITEEKDGWWWTIPKHKTKNDRHENAGDLRVPLIGRALEIVQRLIQKNSGNLFPSRSKLGRLVQKQISKEVNDTMEYSVDGLSRGIPLCPVQNWSPHDLRRTARTMLSSIGCPNEIGEAILGHMAPGVQGDYNRYQYDTERRVWLTKLAEKLELCAGSPCSGVEANPNGAGSRPIPQPL